MPFILKELGRVRILSTQHIAYESLRISLLNLRKTLKKIKMGGTAKKKKSNKGKN